MVDLRLHDPPEQECVGPEGHVPRQADGRIKVPIYREHIADFPNILLVAEPAPVGRPCIGHITQLFSDSVKVIGKPHGLLIAVRPDPVLRSAPTAALGAFRDFTGQVHDGFMYIPDGDQLPISMAERMLDAWRTLLDTGRVALKSGGRPPGITQHPDFIPRVIRAAYDHFQTIGTLPGVDDILAATGASASRYYERMGEEAIKTADIKIAASFGSFEEALAYIDSIQQKRRQQRR